MVSWSLRTWLWHQKYLLTMESGGTWYGETRPSVVGLSESEELMCGVVLKKRERDGGRKEEERFHSLVLSSSFISFFSLFLSNFLHQNENEREYQFLILILICLHL